MTCRLAGPVSSSQAESRIGGCTRPNQGAQVPNAPTSQTRQDRPVPPTTKHEQLRENQMVFQDLSYLTLRVWRERERKWFKAAVSSQTADQHWSPATFSVPSPWVFAWDGNGRIKLWPRSSPRLIQCRQYGEGTHAYDVVCGQQDGYCQLSGPLDKLLSFSPLLIFISRHRID